MLLDRIAQIALIFFGALILVLLVMGLSVSCRGTSADPLVTVTVPVPGFPGDSVVVTLPASSPTPSPIVDLSPTGTPGSAGDSPAPTQPDQIGSPAATTAPDQSTGPGATATPLPGTSGMVPGMTARHAVSRGEWVLQIARCYGVTYESVLGANHLPNPDYILPGAILTIPNIGALGRITGPPCVVSYNVAAGDTWESLAQRYGTTTAILQRANPGALSVGRAIWVPRVP